MNDLKIFTSEQFGSVRTVEINGEPWLVGRDVAETLGYAKPQNAIAAHVDDEDKKVAPIQGTPGGTQEMTIINESGFISLVLSSKMPKAKEYKRWVTSEVLPTIRKTGMYMSGEAMAYVLADPKNAIELLTKYVKAQEEIKAEREARKLAEAQNAIMAPKAEYFDDLIDRSVNLNFRTVAKEFGVKEKWFIGKLKSHGYIYKDSRGQNVPYAEKNNGLFVVKECKGYYSDWAGVQTFITPKGRETFRRFVKKWKEE